MEKRELWLQIKLKKSEEKCSNDKKEKEKGEKKSLKEGMLLSPFILVEEKSEQNSMKRLRKTLETISHVKDFFSQSEEQKATLQEVTKEVRREGEKEGEDWKGRGEDWKGEEEDWKGRGEDWKGRGEDWRSNLYLQTIEGERIYFFTEKLIESIQNPTLTSCSSLNMGLNMKTQQKRGEGESFIEKVEKEKGEEVESNGGKKEVEDRVSDGEYDGVLGGGGEEGGVNFNEKLPTLIFFLILKQLLPEKSCLINLSLLNKLWNQRVSSLFGFKPFSQFPHFSLTWNSPF